MLSVSFNVSIDKDLKFIATSFTITTIVLSSFTVLLDLIIIVCLVYYSKLRRRSSKSNGRRIVLLYSTNTYIHIIGTTTTFLIMSMRTLFHDIFFSDSNNLLPSWHCRLLNYFTCMFPAGIYGSCFLQALYRFWHVTKSHGCLYRKFSFHTRLIFIHWLFILLICFPIWFRSVYLPTENYCLNRFDDTLASAYISLTCVLLPLCGLILVYIKIVLYMKTTWHSRKRFRRTQRDIAIIKKIILLVLVLFGSSNAAIILWLLMFFQQRLHPLSYRLLCLMIEIGMLLSSITLLIVSPQLRRALKLMNYSHTQQLRQRSNNDMYDSLNINQGNDEETKFVENNPNF